MARDKKTKRKPQPKYFEDVEVDSSIEKSFNNNTREVSSVEYVRVRGPPYLRVRVSRTVGGDKQTVVENSNLWRFDDGKIKFKETPTDSNLTVGKDQELTVKLTNPKSSVGSVFASIHIEKDQILPRSD